MRTFEEIAEDMGLFLLKNMRETGPEELLVFLFREKKQKKPKSKIDRIGRVRALILEKVSDEKIIKEVGLTDIDTLSDFLLENWNYPEGNIPKEMSTKLNQLSKQARIPESEVAYFLLSIITVALKKTMLKTRPPQ